MKAESSFYDLQPHKILAYIEKEGFLCTGRFLQLNSYENRVFRVDLEDREPLIAKFYRPGRWDRFSLEEEHGFLQDLKEEGLPVVAPYQLKNGGSFDQEDGIYYSLFPLHKGRMPDELLPKDLKMIGRSLARMHNVGGLKDFNHRPFIDGQDHGWEDLDFLESWIDPHLAPQYQEAAKQILNRYIDLTEGMHFQRVHGDCHRGNLLFNGTEYFFIDFDDCAMGPVAQDLWMLVSGNEDQKAQETLINSYLELRSFPQSQLSLFPCLQGLRVIHYSAWIAKRWEDASFPQLFPHFGSYGYWAEELKILQEIAEKLD